jgi:hypothetical protein
MKPVNINSIKISILRLIKDPPLILKVFVALKSCEAIFTLSQTWEKIYSLRRN